MDNYDNDFNNYDHQPNHEINSRHGRSRSTHSRLNLREDHSEFATDFLVDEVKDGNSTSGALIAGALGLAASVMALFMHPLILGIMGISFGCFAIAKGNKIIGYLAIGIGLLAAILPMFYTGPVMSIL